MKTWLPHWQPKVEFLSDGSRGTALNHLNRFLKACRLSGCQQNMQMVGHQNKFMKFVESAVPTGKQLAHYNIRYTLSAKEFSALPGMRTYKVDAGLVNSSDDATHESLQGLKPLASGAGRSRG